MTLEFLPQAEQEAAEAAYYEQADPGLGLRFREEIESITANLLLHPLLWRQRSGGHRRVNLPGFPFYVASESASSPSAMVRANRITSVNVCASHPPPDYPLRLRGLRTRLLFY